MFALIILPIYLAIWLAKIMIQMFIAGLWLFACVLITLVLLFSGGKADVRYPRFPWWVL